MQFEIRDLLVTALPNRKAIRDEVPCKPGVADEIAYEACPRQTKPMEGFLACPRQTRPMVGFLACPRQTEPVTDWEIRGPVIDFESHRQELDRMLQELGAG